MKCDKNTELLALLSQCCKDMKKYSYKQAYDFFFIYAVITGFMQACNMPVL